MSREKDARIRRVVFFSGEVQGVGFRYTAVHLAREFEVTGFVRNLADGRVELVAEGSKEEVTRFISAIESRMRPYIAERNAADSAATGEFGAFDIAR